MRALSDQHVTIEKMADHPCASPVADELIHEIIAADVGRGIVALAAAAGPAQITRAVGLLSGSARVGVVTGFFVPRAAKPAGETDGPLGAVQVVSCLESLGVQVELITDEPCAPVLQAAKDAAGCRASLYVAPLDPGAYLAWQDVQLSRWRNPDSPLDGLVFIERVGPSRSGPPRNMLGEDISAWTAPLHVLADAGPWYTIGVGDGGNEIGMGRYDAELLSAVPYGEFVQCTTTADAIVVCGVSNWGAAGLVAALSCLTECSGCATALDEHFAYKILMAMVDAGAVDGVTAKQEACVDGMPWQTSAEVLTKLARVVREPHLDTANQSVD
jgi:hypothetical protein